MSATPTITDQWSDGKRLHVTGTIAFAGSYAVGGEILDWGTAGVRSSLPPIWVHIDDAGQFDFSYRAGNLVSNGLLVAKLNGPQAATGTITSSGVNVSDGNTVKVGATTYTFKTVLTPSANQVLIGPTASASLVNLINAINANPEFVGISYGAVTPNAEAFAPMIADGGLVVTVVARLGGTAGNSVDLAKVAVTLTVSSTDLTNGAALGSDTGELTAATYPIDLAAMGTTFYAIFDQFI